MNSNLTKLARLGMALCLLGSGAVDAWLPQPVPPPLRSLAPPARLPLAPARARVSRYSPTTRMAAGGDDAEPPVDKATFMAAVDVLNNEMAKV